MTSESAVNLLLQPWYLLLALLSECVRQEQEKVIEYLRTENEILMEKLAEGRVLLDDDQRRRLAVKGKILGRKKLREFATIAQADTILRWHRQRVVQNRYSRPRCRAIGRPRTDQAIVKLALRMARENVSWGYRRIQGALANVGHHICSSTVANILKVHGVEPAPRRKRQLPWRFFLKAHWDTLNGVDLATIFASVRRFVACLRQGVTTDRLLDEPTLRQPGSPSIYRFLSVGPAQDPASHGDQTDNGSFEGPRPLCIRPPPSWRCGAKLDNQLYGRRAA